MINKVKVVLSQEDDGTLVEIDAQTVPPFKQEKNTLHNCGLCNVARAK